MRILVVLGALVFCASSLSAEFGIKRINAGKSYVVIKAGRSSGVTKSSKVCFYNDDTEAACGTARKVGKSAAMVKVPSSKISSISMTSTAKLSGGSGSMTMSSKKRKRRKRRGRKNQVRTNVKALYSYMFLSPGKYNTVFYEHIVNVVGGNQQADQDPKRGGTLIPFNVNKQRPLTTFGNSYFGGGLEFEYAINKKMSVAVGGRFNAYAPSAVNSYIGEDRNGLIDNSGYASRADEFISAVTNSYSLGGWIDYLYGVGVGRSMLFKFGVGVDFDYNSMSFDVFHKNDSETLNVRVASNGGGATLMSLGARLPIDFSYNTKKFGIGLKIIPSYAFTGFASATEVVINGPDLPTLPELSNPTRLKEWSDDINLLFGHEAGGLALEIQPIYFSFFF